MVRAMKRFVLVGVVAITACGDSAAGPDARPDAAPLGPTANPAREITATDLAFDLVAKTATAKLPLAGSDQPGASFETGDLTIVSVTDAAGNDVPFTNAHTADSTPTEIKSLL